MHDPQGELVADTMLLKDEIELRDLPPIREPSAFERAWLDFVRLANRTFETVSARRAASRSPRRARSRKKSPWRWAAAPASPNASAIRPSACSPSPCRSSKVARVVGAITVETSDVTQIIAIERAALIPLILVAVLVAIITAMLLTLGIARPLRNLARASDQVRTGATERLDLGKLHEPQGRDRRPRAAPWRR